MTLYSDHAEEFSKSRAYPWKGWSNIFKYIDKKKKLKILDLGFGNGRFYNYLADWLLDTKLIYIGIDDSPQMIALAERNIDKRFNPKDEIVFKQLDLATSSWEDNFEENDFDIIVGFGILHHIEKYHQRRKILEKSVNLLKNNAISMFSYWQFGNDREFLRKHKVRDLQPILDASEFREHDYILSYGKNGAYRFAHHFVEQEMKSLNEDLGISIMEEYSADGKDNTMNRYIISKKS